MGAARDDRECEPPLPVVDLVTEKCRPGKLSRTVSRTLLALDMTVVCTPGVVVPPPAVTSGTAVPPATVASEGIDVGTSLPVVAAPVPVLEKPSPLAGRGGLLLSFRSRCYWSLQIFFRWWRPLPLCLLLLYPDGRPRLPRKCWHGARRTTRRRPFRLIVCTGGALSGCSGRGQSV